MHRTDRSPCARVGTTALAVVLALGLLAACSSGSKAASSETGAHKGVTDGELVGLFRLAPGTVSGSRITGTWFRMVQPGGSTKTGPYMINASSPADGGKATLLTPGTSGGLRTAGYQSEPATAFDAGGNSVANAITQPTPFFGVRFSISTNQKDPQTKTDVPPPTVVLKGGKLAADLSAWAASWNHQEFNQGAPKPVTSTGAKAPGQEKVEKVWDWVAQRYLASAPRSTVTGNGATGTLDPVTGAFVLEWTSYIEGGPFNGFTGLWHLEGVFEPSGRAPGQP